MLRRAMSLLAAVSLVGCSGVTASATVFTAQGVADSSHGQSSLREAYGADTTSGILQLGLKESHSNSLAPTVFANAKSTKTTAKKSTKSAQGAQIVVNSQSFADNVPILVKNKTTWMPLSVVMSAMQAMGACVSFDGQKLLINNLALQSTSLQPQKANTIEIANGWYVAGNVPVITANPSTASGSGGGQTASGSGFTGATTTGGTSRLYIPIWYVDQALQEGVSGYFARWKDGTLILQNDATGTPSAQEIAQVMSQVTENHNESEHFVQTGNPVRITLANGDTYTAVLGTRSPSSDGYGQLVFFFHNYQFVGIDSAWEKNQVTSIEAGTSGLVFNVTYANYAPGDALGKPSLKPVTVAFKWNGSEFLPPSKSSIPYGAQTSVKVGTSRVGTASNQTQDLVLPIPSAANKAIMSAIPNGSTLVTPPLASSPFVSVDLNGNGQMAYAAAYKSSHSSVGLVVVGQVSGTWKILWNQVSKGSQLAMLRAGDMTGDGTQEIAFQSYVGDGANDVWILKSVGGKLKSILHTEGTADIGDFNQSGQMEVAVWQHDTGVLENIQMYAWDPSKSLYAPAQNTYYPQYFAGAPLVYYTSAVLNAGSNQMPPKMLAYALASTFLDMGIYSKAVDEAQQGMKQPANDYPSNSAFKSILSAAQEGQSELTTYMNLPSQIKQVVDDVVLKYSGFYNPVSESTPLVTAHKDATYEVRVIGTFSDILQGKYLTAPELNFRVSKNGKVIGPLDARDAVGNVLWSQSKVTKLPGSAG